MLSILMVIVFCRRKPDSDSGLPCLGNIGTVPVAKFRDLADIQCTMLRDQR